MKAKNNTRPGPQLEAAYKKFAAMSDADVLNALHSTAAGLTAADAAERLEQNGPNQVRSAKATPWYVFLGKSFLDEFILVLLFLSVVSAFLGDMEDASFVVMATA